MEIISFKTRVYDNILEIIPDSPIEDNCIYEIRFKDLEAENGTTCSLISKITTKLSPLFCDIDSVKVLIGNMEIDDNDILYHIREASRFAEYVKGSKLKEDNVPFEAVMFTRYKAAHDCILSHSISMASTTGLKGSVGDVAFEQKETTKDIGRILSHLCSELKRWEDEVKGYKLEGRAKMKAVTRGGSATPAFNPYGAALNRGITNDKQ